MKYFVDGDQLAITKDDFINLQESPALFYSLESEIAKTVLEAGRIIALPIGNLMRIRGLLEMGDISTAAPDCPELREIEGDDPEEVIGLELDDGIW